MVATCSYIFWVTRASQKGKSPSHVIDSLAVIYNSYFLSQSEEEIDGGKDIVIALNEMELRGDDPFLDQYRARRLQELKEQAKAGTKRYTPLTQSKKLNAVEPL